MTLFDQSAINALYIDQPQTSIGQGIPFFAVVRALLQSSQVDYYGAPTPLRQIANLSAPESSLLVIQPYDKSSIPSIEKAIMSSDLNLTPNNDGNLIRINVPQLTAVRPHCSIALNHMQCHIPIIPWLTWILTVLWLVVSSHDIYGYVRVAQLFTPGEEYCRCG